MAIKEDPAPGGNRLLAEETAAQTGSPDPQIPGKHQKAARSAGSGGFPVMLSGDVSASNMRDGVTMPFSPTVGNAPRGPTRDDEAVEGVNAPRQ